MQKGNKKKQKQLYWKRKIVFICRQQYCLFCDKAIYKNATRTSKFNKGAGYKINTEKSIVFQSTGNI